MSIDEFEIGADFAQAEFSNVDTEDDSGNPLKWKKGEKLHRWTNGKYYVVVRVKRDSCNVVIKKVEE